MRILVVEDNPNKLRRVLRALESVPGCTADQIDSAHNAIDARRYLRAEQYDLMILDIALPEQPDENPSRHGGIKLIEEILNRDIYKRPREIVGLTAYREVLEAAGRRFAEDLWLVIHYDATTETWSEQLQRKVRHILLAERSAPLLQYRAHLCVVTALQDPELKAVLEIDWNWSKFELPSDPTVYYRGVVHKDAESREIIAACAPRMGMAATAVLATKMIHQFRPRFLSMAGILAGVKGNCSLGDIVVADPSWDWGSGKYYLKGRVHMFAPAPYQIPLDSFLRSKLTALSSDHTALQGIKSAWRGIKVANTLRMHLGPVASGASVLSDPDVARAIVQQHRKLMGIEMETYGLLAAAEECLLPQPRSFSIKSVSDFADVQKTETHRSYAAYTSAAALKLFVERYL